MIEEEREMAVPTPLR
jgi:DNA-binding MarR family transcriptional regulator